MFTRCIVCRAAFPPGTLVEHFPVGRRIAYDPLRGRLWAICQACSSWTLAPVEERWEAIEELERLVTASAPRRGRVVLAAETDNIALYMGGGTQVVRVGRAELREEASWRYGLSGEGRARGMGRPVPFAPRRLSIREWLLGGAFVMRSTLSVVSPRTSIPAMRRWVRYGSVAWRGDHECAACSHSIRELSFPQSRLLILTDQEGDAMTPSLVRACPRCHDETSGGLRLEGTDAEFVLRRVLAYHQDPGVPDGYIRTAMELIEGGGGAPGLSRLLVKYGRYLGELPLTSQVALRIIANDARERRLLELEATAIERQWRREEELASIIDTELTTHPRRGRARP